MMPPFPPSPLPHGGSAPSPLCLPGGPSTEPGHGGRSWLWSTGLGLGVGFGRGVGCGVVLGVGGGVTAGGVAVGLGVVAGAVGPLVGAADGPDPGGCGVGRTATMIAPLGAGSPEGEVLGDDGAVADGVDAAGVADDGGAGVAPTGSREGRTVPAGVDGAAATLPGACRGAPIPTAIANVASTRLRTPSATTSRARWADVTSLGLSFPPGHCRPVRAVTDPSMVAP